MCILKKKSSSRPITIKLGINHHWVKGILNCPLQKGDNHKNGVGSFKNLLLQNHWARIDHIYMNAFKKEIYWQCDLMAIKKSYIACVHWQTISQYDSGERCGPWASCLVRNQRMHIITYLICDSSLHCTICQLMRILSLSSGKEILAISYPLLNYM
jgi:hypothetical protein